LIAGGGKVAVVTGSAQGIGLEIAQRFALDDWRVVLVDRDRGPLESSSRSLVDRFGDAVTSVHADLTTAAGRNQTLNHSMTTFDRVDALVNNAGKAEIGPFLDATEDQLRRALSINVEAVFLLSQLFAKSMMAERRNGSIVNIGTANALVGIAGTAAYSASKGAIHALSRALAVELGPHGIRCNVVAPGTVLTERVLGILDEAGIEKRRSRIPIGRLAEVHDVAAAAVFLASDDAAFVNGHVLVVDGGFSIMGA